ncbi:phage holin family protein [Chitinophaga lutea]
MKTLFAAEWTSFSISYHPSYNLLVWVFIAMVLDLLTGLINAYLHHTARRSAGLRKTLRKFTQYAGSILVSVILMNTFQQDHPVVRYLNDGLLVMLIYIETTSVFENLYAMDSTSMFARYFIGPVLRLLTLSIRKMQSKSMDN